MSQTTPSNDPLSNEPLSSDEPVTTSQSQMVTSSYILEKLRLKRQDNEFTMTPEGFTAGKGKYYNPEDLKIIKIFRFEGDSNPSDSDIIYVIEANDGLVGYSQDAYGMYSSHDDEKYDEFIRRVPIEDRDEQLIFN